MTTASVLYLAAVISAHRDGQVAGRTRLQKTIKLLQRLGLPTDYRYSIHFYGPYSEGLQADTALLRDHGLLDETPEQVDSGYPRYILKLSPNFSVPLPNVTAYTAAISKMELTPSVILELAATYDAFREQGANHDKAMEWVRLKKGEKCDHGNIESAQELLRNLHLLPRGKTTSN